MLTEDRVTGDAAHSSKGSRKDVKPCLPRVYRFFFGEDFFITYGRADAGPYAAALANRLSKAGFTCFLDQWHPVVDSAVPPDVLRVLRHASVQVLVATPAAAVSTAVAEEVAVFARSGRPVVPIDVANALSGAPWAEMTRGIARSVETRDALENGRPSVAVVDRLVNTFEFQRRTWRVRVSLSAFALLSVVSASLSFWQAGVADQERRSAATATVRANEQAATARRAASAAEEERIQRLIALDRLRVEERVSEANAKRADQQASEALARGRLADSRALAITSRTQRLAVDQRLLLATRAWQLDPNLDARDALSSAVWDAGALVRILYSPNPALTREIVGVGMSSDGRLAVAGYADGSLVAWTLADSPVRRTQWQRPGIGPSGRKASAAALSQDGNFAAIGRIDGAVELIVIRDRTLGPRKQLTSTTGESRLPVIVTALAFSPDGKRLAAGWSDGKVRIFDTSTGAVSGDLGDPFDATANYHRLGTVALAWRSDSTRLVSSHGGGRLMFWTAEGSAAEPPVAITPGADANSVVFAPSGDALYVAAGAQGQLLRLALGRSTPPAVTPLRDEPMGAWSRIALGAGGRELLVQPLHAAARAVPLERNDTERPLGIPPLDDTSAISTTPDARNLITGRPDGTVAIYDVRTQSAAVRTLGLTGDRILFDVAGARVIAVGSTVQSQYLRGDAEVRSVPSPWLKQRSTVLAAEAVPEGIRVHLSDGRMLTCDARHCQEGSTPPADPARDIWQDSESRGAWKTSTADRVAICNPARCYDPPASAGMPQAARRFALASRGALWAYSTDRDVFLCRAAACREVPGLEEGSNGWIGAIAFTPGDSELVVGTSEGRVRFASTSTYREVTPPRTPHGSAVTKIVFDGRGTMMATGGRGSTVVLWELSSKRPLGSALQGPVGTQVLDVALSPVGDRLAVLYSSGQIDVHELDPARLAARACDIAGRTFSAGEWALLGGSGTACPATCAPPGSLCATADVRATVHR
jgi:WD40 repeat protein